MHVNNEPNMENRDTRSNTNWHSIPANTVLETLECSAEGLTLTEVETRFVKYGANRLPQAARSNSFVRLIKILKN